MTRQSSVASADGSGATAAGVSATVPALLAARLDGESAGGAHDDGRNQERRDGCAHAKGNAPKHDELSQGLRSVRISVRSPRVRPLRPRVGIRGSAYADPGTSRHRRAYRGGLGTVQPPNGTEVMSEPFAHHRDVQRLVEALVSPAGRTRPPGTATRRASSGRT